MFINYFSSSLSKLSFDAKIKVIVRLLPLDSIVRMDMSLGGGRGSHQGEIVLVLVLDVH